MNNFERWVKIEYIPPEAKKTKVEQLAELLGIEVGKPFNLRWKDGKISNFNPHILSADGVLTDRTGDKRLQIWADIIQGKVTVEKIPQEPEKWRPKRGERYYYVNGLGDIMSFCWGYATIDCALWLMGNRFPTKETAEAAQPEIMAKYEAIRQEIEG